MSSGDDGHPPTPPRPKLAVLSRAVPCSEEIAAHLDQLAADAREGNITGIAYVVTRVGQDLNYFYLADWRECDWHHLVAGAAYLHGCLVNETLYDGEGEDDGEYDE